VLGCLCYSSTIFSAPAFNHINRQLNILLYTPLHHTAHTHYFIRATFVSKRSGLPFQLHILSHSCECGFYVYYIMLLVYALLSHIFYAIPSQQHHPATTIICFAFHFPDLRALYFPCISLAAIFECSLCFLFSMSFLPPSLSRYRHFPYLPAITHIFATIPYAIFLRHPNTICYSPSPQHSISSLRTLHLHTISL